MIAGLELQVVPTSPKSEKPAPQLAFVPGPGQAVLLVGYLQEAVGVDLGDLSGRKVRLKHSRQNSQGALP